MVANHQIMQIIALMAFALTQLLPTVVIAQEPERTRQLLPDLGGQ